MEPRPTDTIEPEDLSKFFLTPEVISKLDDSLVKYLKSQNLYDTPRSSNLRTQAITEVETMLQAWVAAKYKATLGDSFPEQSEESVKLFYFGSYRLQVHGPDSDIDSVAVFPKFVVRDEFFVSFVQRLEDHPHVTELKNASAAKVPVVKFKIRGIDFDVGFARLQYAALPKDLDLSKDDVLANCDHRSIASINGCRVNERILQLVPALPPFLTLLRALRLWSKRRGISGNKYGFFGGINLALLACKLCRLLRGHSLSPVSLLAHWLIVYHNWAWPNPVIPQGEITRPAGSRLPQWEGVSEGQRGRAEVMPIITTAFPVMNSAAKVLPCTLRLIKDEIHMGIRELIRMGVTVSRGGEPDWSGFFMDCSLPAAAPTCFFHRHRIFLRLTVSSLVHDDHESAVLLREFLDPQLRQLFVELEHYSEGGQGNQLFRRYYPLPLWFGDKEGTDEESGAFSMFIALEPLQEKGQIDISGPLKRFQDSIESKWRRDCDAKAREPSNAVLTITAVTRKSLPASLRAPRAKGERKRKKRKRTSEPEGPPTKKVKSDDQKKVDGAPNLLE
eukprot:gnl/Dysnectes_brevis/3837_a4952_951.p1 GENE.gnl/Dysnectes_brevis/3837_a4952_951~~gnl/Dysnectes_brevis/3837_a4952_951.p1  ORF type:complete len:567 (-),score=117.03 gnl/Dysnectes_brevis/3837_a4952_951:95-1771(-)